MNWITNFVRPKIKSFWGSRETPENLWRKCPGCGEMVFHRDLEAAQNVCPACDHHLRLTPKERFTVLFDGPWEELPSPEVPADPLRFRDERRYGDRLKDARSKTGQQDSIVAAKGMMGGVPVVIAVQNFAFMGGSLGMAAGEMFIASARASIADRRPYIFISASGGARMQEGILSLMQLPRTTAAVEEMKDAGIPYLAVLADPTTGGVLAAYAMLGDIHIAEPGALIGFSGRRVIEQTIREKLPEGFQRAEFQKDHGMVDLVVHRHKLKETLARLVRLLMVPVEAVRGARFTPQAPNPNLPARPDSAS